MLRRNTGPHQTTTPFSASKWRVFALLLAVIPLAGSDLAWEGTVKAIASQQGR